MGRGSPPLPLPPEVRPVVPLGDQPGRGIRVQERPAGLVDLAGDHDAGHRQGEQPGGQAVEPGRVPVPGVLHEVDRPLRRGPGSQARRHLLVVPRARRRRPGPAPPPRSRIPSGSGRRPPASGRRSARPAATAGRDGRADGSRSPGRSPGRGRAPRSRRPSPPRRWGGTRARGRRCGPRPHPARSRRARRARGAAATSGSSTSAHRRRAPAALAATTSGRPTTSSSTASRASGSSGSTSHPAS